MTDSAKQTAQYHTKLYLKLHFNSISPADFWIVAGTVFLVDELDSMELFQLCRTSSLGRPPRNGSRSLIRLVAMSVVISSRSLFSSTEE